MAYMWQEGYGVWIGKNLANAPVKLRAEGRGSCPDEKQSKKREPKEPSASTGG